VASGILSLATSGSADKVLRDMRVRSLFSPYYFIKVVLGAKDLIDQLHNETLETFIQRWIAGYSKQGVEFPRGFLKTTMFTTGVSVWIVLPFDERDTDYALNELKIDEQQWFERMGLHDQDATQLLAFENMDNSKKKVREIKWHFEENVLFRTLFPEIAYSGSEKPWNDECLRIRRVGFGQRQAEGTFEAIGVNGALQSRHYKIVWEDDLVGKAATESSTTMLSTIRWHGLLAGAFENAANQTRFLISNRWGYEDLNGHVRKNEPDFHFHTRSAWEKDPATGELISTWPERYPIDKLLAIRDSGSMTRYDFACQYLNQPVLPGERELDLEKLHHYEVDENGRMCCSCGAKFSPSQLIRFIHYDPYNAKGARSTSCPAIAVVGTSVDKHVFLLDLWTYKGSYAQVFRKILDLNNRWRPYLFTYEDVGSQNMTEFYLRQAERTVEFKDRKLPRIQPVKTGGKPKEVRIRDFLFPVIQGEGGRKFSCRKSQIVFTEQLEAFPSPSLLHDYDGLDVLAQGARVWRFPLSDEEIQVTQNSEAEDLARLGVPYSYIQESVA